MNITNAVNFENMVSLEGNEVMTTSLKVAEYFGRKHKTILRAIRNLSCSKEFNERNYVPVNYIDEKGELREMFNITRDGCMFLIMGFTGEAAAQVKETYIKAFNWMSAQLQNMKMNYMDQHNSLMLEYLKEKDVASMSGRLLRRWGREKKPELITKLETLQQKSQLNLLM